MAHAGWIKVYRKIRGWRYWPAVTGKKFSKSEAWLDLILEANHQDRVVGKILVRRGLLLTGKPKLDGILGVVTGTSNLNNGGGRI